LDLDMLVTAKMRPSEDKRCVHALVVPGTTSSHPLAGRLGLLLPGVGVVSGGLL